MRITLAALLLIARGASGCISTAPRQFSAPNVQFQQAPAPVFQQQPAFVAPGRAAVFGSPNEANVIPVGAGQSRQVSVLEYLLGNQIRLAEFSADGYNAQGGGPVNSGAALSCRYDGAPCCWANVPPPDDQLDWQIATGVPDSAHFQIVPKPDGSYLVAYARGAAPSDEAQFASCAITCASSPITVRAKHWQSENVLLQVCQRESFPNTVNFNPLLNCQEFPLVNGIAATEVVLPKASLVDIVFVASNFVGENGDMAILDDIEISYDRNGEECQQQAGHTVQSFTEESDADSENSVEAAVHEQTLEGHQKPSTIGFKGERFGTPARVAPPGAASNGGEAAEGAEVGAATGSIRSTVSISPTSETETTGRARAHGDGTFKHPGKQDKKLKAINSSEQSLRRPPAPACEATSCSFENENTCSYVDAHQSQSVRGLTTKFQVVTGQFMNKVTGVKSGKQGDYYAATFLFPREMAGLETSTEPFKDSARLRFHFYEGTHGLQLKGCCGSVEDCPFQSDKFVTVSDRVWKTGHLTCPAGTDRVIFVCENTRTNQGACAIDDIAMVSREGPIETAATVC